MDKNSVLYYNNSKWGDLSKNPLVSVVICLFNRRNTIVRAIQSIEVQTFKDIELIVVDNGSTIKVDDIVIDYLEKVSIPMMFIRREYGMGPMTGRNTGIKIARGKYIALLDDDDEFLPGALECLVDEWNNIPEERRHEYREVVGLCQDQNGRLIGKPFPDGINELPWRKALKTCNKSGSAHIALNRSDILKSLPFIEPEGVTMVTESLLWEQLAVKYKSWFFNEVVYRYYLNSSDSYCHTAKKRNPKQIVVNGLYNSKYRIEHKRDFQLTFFRLCRLILIYDLYSIVLMRRCGGIPDYEWAKQHPKGYINHLLRILAYLPAWILSFMYIRRSFR